MRSLGADVVVLEAADRRVARAVSPEMSRWLLEAHAASGIDFRLKTGVARFLGANGKVTGVETSDGAGIDADLVLVGIGATADDGAGARLRTCCLQRHSC